MAFIINLIFHDILWDFCVSVSYRNMFCLSVKDIYMAVFKRMFLEG